MFASILHEKDLKLVISPFLKIQTFFYMNDSFGVFFFIILNPGHRYSCGLYRLLKLRQYLQFIS